MRSLHLLLALLLTFVLAACPQPRGSLGDDDDDGADDDDDSADGDGVGDDDDTVGDDDDFVGDDDDATGDDDDVADDDDFVGDDDDATPGDPGEAMVGETYCIDWASATITEPPDIQSLLSIVGISLEDYPLLINPTGVDVAAGTIDMLGATAQPSTCTQDLAVDTLPLTDTTPGTWAAPGFSIGPTDLALNIPSVGLVALENATLTGDFTGDAQQIINGTMDGLINVAALDAACFVLTCVTCPSTGADTCAAFEFEDAEWNNNGQGALTPVP